MRISYNRRTATKVNLERIVLAGHYPDDAAYAFYHREETGAIFLHAWHEDLWTEHGILVHPVRSEQIKGMRSD